MQSRIDKFGRVLIPKKIRQTVGLHPGMSVQLEALNGDIVLKPTSQKNVLIHKQGVLVHTGQPEGDASNILKIGRKERIKKVSFGQGE